MQLETSQVFESFVPVYDVMPETWEQARPAVVEQLKKLTNAVNAREIGFFLDEELLSGKQYLPGLNIAQAAGGSQQFRTMLRKVIVFPSLVIGANTQPHGIFIDGNFTLIQLWGSGTNVPALTGKPFPNTTETITYNATNIIITTTTAYTRGVAVIEYIQEL
jgi:hypothetical protein